MTLMAADVVFTKVSVENFRAIGSPELELAVAPVTILVGPNGAGKSSVLEALALTAQSAIEEPRRHDLVLAGDRFSVPMLPTDGGDEARSIYHKHDSKLRLTVGFEIKVDEGAAAFGTQPPEGMAARGAWPPSRLGYRWTRWSAGHFTSWSHFLRIADAESSIVQKLDLRGTSNADIRYFLNVPLQKFKDSVRILSARNERVLMTDLFPRQPEVDLPDALRTSFLHEYSRLHDTLLVAQRLLLEKLSRVVFMSALRGRQFLVRDVGPDVRFVGKHGEHVVKYLAKLSSRTSPTFDKLRDWAKRFDLPDLEAGWVGNKELQVRFVDHATKTPLDLAEAASGSMQGLMLATQVLLAERDATILIEEPEIGMHPAYERLLAELFADSVKSGHQIIAATHSEVLVAALANAVRKRLLQPEDVAIWHLVRKNDSVAAEIIPIDERGYLDNWIKSFAAVDKDLYDEWAETLPKAGTASRRGHRAVGKRSDRRKGRKTRR